MKKYFAMTSLSLVTAFSVQAREPREPIGRCRPVYENRTRENADDAAHRNGIQAAINQINRDLEHVRPRFNSVKEDYKGVEAKLQGATTNLESFRNANANQVRDTLRRRTQIEQSSEALLRSKNLADLVEKLIAFSADDFVSELSFETRTIDLSTDFVVPAACPAYASDSDTCQIYRSFYEAVDADLTQWKAMGLPIDRVVDVSLTLRGFLAIQRNSVVELGLVQRDLAQQNRQLEGKLAALKASDEAGRAVSAQLVAFEAEHRSALIDFDRAAAILRVADTELKALDAALAARQKEISEFKVRTENYRVQVDSFCP